VITHVFSLLHICHFAGESHQRSHIDKNRPYLHISLSPMSIVHHHQQLHTRLHLYTDTGKGKGKGSPYLIRHWVWSWPQSRQ